MIFSLSTRLNSIQAVVFILASLVVGSAAFAKTEATKPKLSAIQRQARLRHAHELLGGHYSRSRAKHGEDIPKINGMIYRTALEKLPKKFKAQHQKIAQAIIDESLKYEFDPVFIVSVIDGESSWRPLKIGGVGEVGLMQIRPETAQWIAQRDSLAYGGPDDLKNPVINIRIGAAYFAYLRDHYDSNPRLYIAAYNMGQRNVASALERNILPKDYPLFVMKRYFQYYERYTEEMKAKQIRKNG